MPEIPPATSVTLIKRKALAPPFHQHIARGKLVGSVVQTGDYVVVYEVSATEPSGPVEVTDRTQLHFA